MLEFAITVPLRRDASRLLSEVETNVEIVLLGSIATPKYIEPLTNIFGERLMVPSAFIGMGDMQRGALLLHSVREGNQLSYVAAATILTR